MYAHMGMKIEEWEDGQVNIGIAVCPTKPRIALAAVDGGIDKKGRGNDMFQPNTKGNFVVVPRSALIICPPENRESQGGRVSVTYARNLNGPSNFIIMLNPQDQGYQETISSLHETFQNTKRKEIGDTENMELIEGTQNSSGKAEAFGSLTVSERDGKESSENEKGNNLKESLPVQETDTLDCVANDSLTSPHQSTDKQKEINLEATTSEQQKTEKKATGPSSGNQETSQIPGKRSGDMKRVSWLEDVEKFEDKKGSSGRKSTKENSVSVKKSNGQGNNNNHRNNSTQKQQQGISCVDGSTLDEGYSKGGKRNSGDRSRIPLIATSAGDYPTSSCEFYRRQMLRECGYYNSNTATADNWYGYTSLQKYAGQKVVKKIAAEQKRLEEDISNRRKTEIWILGNEADDFITSPSAVPLRKRTTRLKPMQIVQ